MLELPIHETFGQTLQGEGFWAGTPVDFIRLSGCPVGCSWCDTGYGDGGANLPRQRRPIADLLAELRSPRVVISGGEPFIHPQLPALVTAIETQGRTVSIETSGAFWQDISAAAWITLSPKEHISPQYPVVPLFWERANEIKLVIETGTELAYYQAHCDGHQSVFLQPEWSQREKAIPIILDLLQQHPHYRLSLQIHKYINIP
ncbi:MAG: radical SAM protein [Jaaginema sp. PMC 1079.18]|nr:radical SAM protein [Jaaginema sp. PMC 1080.18]MEC4849858.1 radical SAM protein [Jaaginema sp. PMC 1079.18]MEC4865246.1 radical SAM protein [Jaaginema sp. PMC 1078.18]